MLYSPSFVHPTFYIDIQIIHINVLSVEVTVQGREETNLRGCERGKCRRHAGNIVNVCYVPV